VHKIEFKYEIFEVKSTPRVLVVMDERNVYWFNSASLKKMCSFPCFKSKTIDITDSNSDNIRIQDYSGVIAIGKRWIAFPSDGSVTNKNLDLTTSSNQTYAEMSLGVAKKAASELIYWGDFGMKKVTNYINPEKFPETTPKRNTPQYGMNAGTVEIRDLKTKKLMVQFKAHTEPISAMTFDPSGTLLLTTSVQGTHLNIYQIMPSSNGKVASKNIRHIYRLFRGITAARLKDVQFSINSKWVAVSSTHGTTHLFAINPTGGAVNPMTHLPKSAQNRLLRNNDWNSIRRRQKVEQDPISVSVVDRIHNSSSIFSGSGVNPTSELYASKTSSAFFCSGDGSSGSENENIFICTNTGLLHYYSLEPCLKEQASNDASTTSNNDSTAADIDNILQVKINNCGKWNLCRSKSHDIVTVPIDWKRHQTSSDNEDENFDEDDVKSRWISNVEIETYHPPHTPLWMSGNFKFKTFEAPHNPSELSTSSNGHGIYPDAYESLQDEHTYFDHMSKSIHIRITDPIPYQSSLLSNDEPAVIPIKGGGIMKAIQTPMTSATILRSTSSVPKITTTATTSGTTTANKVNSPWELIQNDDSILIVKESSPSADNIKSSMKDTENSSSNKMKKSVRLSVDDNDNSSKNLAPQQNGVDQYFLNPSPTITGRPSQDVFTNKSVTINKSSTTPTNDYLLSSTSPVLKLNGTPVEADTTMKSSQRLSRSLSPNSPKPTIVIQQQQQQQQTKSPTPSTPSTPSSSSSASISPIEEEDGLEASTVKHMTGSFNMLKEDYFGNIDSDDKSFIAQHSQMTYIADKKDNQSSNIDNTERSSPILQHPDSPLDVVEEEEAMEQTDPFHIPSHVSDNIQHYEPQNSIEDSDEDLDFMESELQKMRGIEDYDSESDEELEIRRSPAAFEINTNFFSKDRPSIQQANSFYGTASSPHAEHASSVEQNILDMQFSGMRDSNNFRSAYDSPVDSGAIPVTTTTTTDYDFESDDEEAIDEM
jgi:hypothetical protein